MKLRMTGNSVRLRVGRSELARFLQEGHIEETIRFAPPPHGTFTWALELGPPGSAKAAVRYVPCDLAVVVTLEQVDLWREGDPVGIYSKVDLGDGRKLELIVEKDFACLDGRDSEEVDTFANPSMAANCQVG